VASAERASQILGWQPKLLQVEEIIRTAWQWYLEHPEGYPGE
jgi:UDP-glucose 4-epimerase